MPASPSRVLTTVPLIGALRGRICACVAEGRNNPAASTASRQSAFFIAALSPRCPRIARAANYVWRVQGRNQYVSTAP
jgi:hypothetical protein